MLNTASQFPNLLDKHLNKVSMETYEDLVKAESMIPKLYNVQSLDSAWYEEQTMAGIQDIPAFTGELEYLQVYGGYSTKIEPAEYAAGIKFERKFIDDNKWGVLKNQAQMLSEAMFRTREKAAVRPFAYAFSSAFDYMTSEEGVALCSGSHTSKSGASTTYGFSNSGTSALNETTLEATRILANKFKNDLGERVFTNFDTILVPDGLSRTAQEIIGTDKGLYSAEGTINVQQGKWKLITYKLLDDYDANNWFLIDSRAMAKFLVWFDRVKPETSSEFKEFDTFAIKHSIYSRWGFGFLNWRWIYGQNVT